MRKARFVIPAVLAIIAVLAAVTTAFFAADVSAHDNGVEYQYLVSPGRDLINPDCDQTDADTAFALCPDRATASNGDVIDIKGDGTLTLHAKSATGGGSFRHMDSDGNVIADGTWTATELLSFKTYGDSPALLGGPPPTVQPTWRTGLAHIRVHLVSDGNEADAILSLGCTLPQVKMPGGVFEGVRLNVQGGLNFNKEVQPRATLFILTSGDDGFPVP